MEDAFGYIRVSTHGQVIHGLGLEVQETMVREFCEANGLRLVTIFRDEGITGAEVDRPGLLELLASLNGVKTVVVPNTGRLWREIYPQAIIMKALRDAKAHLRVVDNPRFDLYEDNPNNVLINAILMAIDCWERSTIRKKLLRARRAKARKGLKASGRAPFGYRWEDGKMVIAPEEAEAVKALFADRLAGATLAELGRRHGRSAEWARQVLKNRFYCGKVSWNDEEYQGCHVAVVSERTYNQVQRRAAGRNTGRRGTPKTQARG